MTRVIMPSSSPGWDRAEFPDLAVMQNNGIVYSFKKPYFIDLFYVYESFTCVLARVL